MHKIKNAVFVILSLSYFKILLFFMVFNLFSALPKAGLAKNKQASPATSVERQKNTLSPSG
jgi:hypothetical protein